MLAIYKEHILKSCISPSFYNIIADDKAFCQEGNVFFLLNDPQNILIKIFKGSPNYFSIDNAMHLHYEAHLLLLDKDTKLPINLPFLETVKATDIKVLLSNIYPAHLHELILVKIGISVKSEIFQYM